jgi:hypothetical protein
MIESMVRSRRSIADGSVVDGSSTIIGSLIELPPAVVSVDAGGGYGPVPPSAIAGIGNVKAPNITVTNRIRPYPNTRPDQRFVDICNLQLFFWTVISTL